MQAHCDDSVSRLRGAGDVERAARQNGQQPHAANGLASSTAQRLVLEGQKRCTVPQSAAISPACDKPVPRIASGSFARPPLSSSVPTLFWEPRWAWSWVDHFSDGMGFLTHPLNRGSLTHALAGLPRGTFTGPGCRRLWEGGFRAWLSADPGSLFPRKFRGYLLNSNQNKKVHFRKRSTLGCA